MLRTDTLAEATAPYVCLGTDDFFWTDTTARFLIPGFIVWAKDALGTDAFAVVRAPYVRLGTRDLLGASTLAVTVVPNVRPWTV